jgi:hypothetical protein
VAQLGEALRYKSEVCGFDFRVDHWDSPLIESFRPHCGPEVAQPLTDMNVRDISWGQRRALREANNLDTIV